MWWYAQNMVLGTRCRKFNQNGKERKLFRFVVYNIFVGEDYQSNDTKNQIQTIIP